MSFLPPNYLDGASLVDDDKVNQVRTYRKKAMLPDGTVGEAECTVYYGADDMILAALQGLTPMQEILGYDGHVSNAGVVTRVTQMGDDEVHIRREENIDPIIDHARDHADATRGQRYNLDEPNLIGNIPSISFFEEVLPRLKDGDDKAALKWLEKNPLVKTTEKRLI